MGWKLFAISYAILTTFGVAQFHDTPKEMIDAAMQATAAVGLVFFAFRIDVIPPFLLKVLAPIYISYSLLVAGQWLYQPHEKSPLSAFIVAFLIFGALHLLVCVGLWKNAFGEPRATEHHTT